VRFWPQDGGNLAAGAPYVLCTWKADPKLYAEYPSPRAVFSLGAGVDHLAVLKGRTGFPIFRVVDPDLTMRMVEYVTFAVLYLHRRIPLYLAQQKARVWASPEQAVASSVRVGIMGAGVMGEACGKALQDIGFNVAGWARTPRGSSRFPVYAGMEELEEFLEKTDVLVNLLPRTAETTGLVNAATFSSLGKRRSGLKYFVSAGRGETVVQPDLIAALQSGALAGAVLDVFTPEPLPANSPLWAMDNVLVTPHIAADSNPATIVPQIIRDIEAVEKGAPLRATVDLERGY